MFLVEKQQIPISVFGLNRLVLELPIYCTWDKHHQCGVLPREIKPWWYVFLRNIMFHKGAFYKRNTTLQQMGWIMVFNTTFNNISVISWHTAKVPWGKLKSLLWHVCIIELYDTNLCILNIVQQHGLNQYSSSKLNWLLFTFFCTIIIQFLFLVRSGFFSTVQTS